MAPGDKIAGIYFGNRVAGDGPIGRRRDGIFRGEILREGLASSESRVGERTPGSGIRDFCVSGLEPFRRDVPFLGGNLDEQVPSCGGYTSKLRSHGWRRAAAECSCVEWRERGVAHDHAVAFEGDGQLGGKVLRLGGGNVLPRSR